MDLFPLDLDYSRLGVKVQAGSGDRAAGLREVVCEDVNQ